MQPQVVFDVLEGAAGQVTLSGSQTLHGEHVSEYTLSTSLQAFMRAEYGPHYRRHGSRPAAQLTVWLDGRGRPVRALATFTARTPRGIAALTLTIDFFGYGAPVSVTAPPRALQRQEPGLRPALTLQDPTRTLQEILFATSPAPKGL